jgi:ankyrin repeat protein
MSTIFTNNTHDITYLARMGKLKSIRKIIRNNPLHLIDIPDKFGKTGLLYAAENDDLEMLKFFLDNEADIDHKDKEGNNVLALAVKHDSEITAEYLINLGIDVNISVNNYYTLLQSAISNENAPLSFKILLNGADPTVLNKRGLDAYQLAQQKLEKGELRRFEEILEKLEWI